MEQIPVRHVLEHHRARLALRDAGEHDDNVLVPTDSLHHGDLGQEIVPLVHAGLFCIQTREMHESVKIALLFKVSRTFHLFDGNERWSWPTGQILHRCQVNAAERPLANFDAELQLARINLVLVD